MTDIISNGQVNSPSDGVRQGLYATSTVQNGSLGAKREMADGRVFRYGYAVSAVGAGQLAALDASVAVQTSFNAAFTNSAGTAADYTSGQTTLYVKTGDITTADAADVFAGGYLHITDEGGEGYTYRLRGNGVGSATATNVMRLDLYDPTQTALDSEDSVSITGSMYNNLAIYNNGTDDVTVGVPLVDVPATSYAWFQTWGPATVLADESAGTIAAGTIAQGSDGVNGAAQPFGGGATNSEDDHSYATEPIIGFFMTAAVDTEYVATMLQIAP